MSIINSPAAWLIVALLAINVCAGLAAPVLVSGTSAEIKEQANNEKQPLDDLKVPQALAEPQSKTSNNAEKLKRGLTNFMNQMNPAPFFIPILPQQQHTNNDSKLASKAATINGAQSSSKPVAIVNDDATAEALMKRPTRPFGPMRFG